jgi:hypothetical protein
MLCSLNLYIFPSRIKCRWKCKYLYNNTYDFRKLWLDNDAMHVHSRDKIRVSKYYSWTDLSLVHFRLDSKIIRCYLLFERVFPQIFCSISRSNYLLYFDSVTKLFNERILVVAFEIFLFIKLSTDATQGVLLHEYVQTGQATLTS